MMKKWAVFLFLLIIALGERLWFDLGPNVELVMLTSVLASVYLGRKWGVGVGVLALLISDMAIGNSLIFIFTWSAYLVIGLAGGVLKRFEGQRRVMASMVFGWLAASWFFIFTNLGVWLLSGMYQKSLNGLVKCYVMGLPFFGVHAVSNMLILPIGFLLSEWVINKNLFKVVEQRLGARFFLKSNS